MPRADVRQEFAAATDRLLRRESGSVFTQTKFEIVPNTQTSTVR